MFQINWQDMAVKTLLGRQDITAMADLFLREGVCADLLKGLSKVLIKL